MQHIVYFKRLVGPWIPLKSFLGKAYPHHWSWRGLTIWGKTFIIFDNKILDVVIGLHGSPGLPIFDFRPPSRLAPDSWLPCQLLICPKIFILALFLIPPLNSCTNFRSHFQDLQLPCRLLAPLGPLIPSLHMLPKSHVDSWFISAS